MAFRLLPLLLLLFGISAHADTLYKCNDDQGHTTYTNQKPSGKNCTIVSQDKAVSTFAAPVRPRANTPTPENFPKVSSDVQKARDTDRRKILDEELATERRKLDEAKKTLSEQEATREGGEKNYQKYLDRLKPYQDQIQLHERNVEALQKEIGKLN